MKGIANNIIDKGNGNVLMSVYIVNIIGNMNSTDKGPTSACAPLTSSAKTDNEMAKAKADRSAINKEIPKIEYDAIVGCNPNVARSTLLIPINPVNEFI